MANIAEACPLCCGAICQMQLCSTITGRQSPARGPNPAREFRPSGRSGSSVLTLNSARKTYRMMSDCFHAERDLVTH